MRIGQRSAGSTRRKERGAGGPSGRRAIILKWQSEDGSVPVHVGPCAAACLPGILAGFGADSVFVLTQPPVARHHLGRMRRVLREFNTHVLLMEDGEASKSLKSVERICGEMIARRATRDSALVCLGGGVVGDVGGFAASILYRGIRCVQMPTTLLAMIDSSIGGKTGVNLGAKNLLGTFSAPAAILADTRFLSTLPQDQFDSALCEAVKTALLDGPDLFEWLTRRRGWKSQRDLMELVARCARFKIGVVERDFREEGLRRILNLGHTLGHAFETRCGLHHGHAVGWGIVAAVMLSHRLGLLGRESASTILSGIRRACHLPPLPRSSGIREAIAVDKKAGRAGLRFIALRSIGRPDVITLRDNEPLIEVASELMGRAVPPEAG